MPKNLLTILFISIFVEGCTHFYQQDATPKNVLFISVDDLRPELGCYGNPKIKTPNIDQISEQGIFFTKAYCQQALCVPSRSSVLTGKRPASVHSQFFGSHFRKKHPDITTLPQVFQKAGYKVNGVGKVFHHRDTLSWDERVWVPEPSFYYPMYATDESRKKQLITLEHQMHFKKDSLLWWAKGDKYVPGPSWESPEVHDTILFDGKITSKAIEYLYSYKDEPFFLAVGFYKPHIPFVAPKKYFDLYPTDDIELPTDTLPPTGAPAIALNNWGETRRYVDIPPSGPITPAKKREMIRGYYACVSYVDAQIGRLMAALKRLGLDRNTMIVIWGDHGYHLGDLNLWGKYTNFEQATKSPLIMHIPWQSSLKHHKITNLVELLDIYPTILDATELTGPKDLEGQSLMEYWHGHTNMVDTLAFSEYTKSGYTGYSVRTPSYRYTWWKPRNMSENDPHYEELYKYRDNQFETINLVKAPQYAQMVESCKESIKKEYKLK